MNPYYIMDRGRGHKLSAARLPELLEDDDDDDVSGLCDDVT